MSADASGSTQVPRTIPSISASKWRPTSLGREDAADSNYRLPTRRRDARGIHRQLLQHKHDELSPKHELVEHLPQGRAFVTAQIGDRFDITPDIPSGQMTSMLCDEARPRRLVS
jgi:hypothetical protein